jgi:hypothetical protein
MDSAAYLDLIPIMTAAPFRYQLRGPKTNDDDNNVGSVYTLIVQLINVVLYVQYHFIQFLLHILVHYTPIYYVTKYCIKVIAVFVMNGESHGTLTVSPKSHIYQESDGMTMSSIRRLRDVNIHINLGYLSHPNDLQRFRQAFAASIGIYENHNTFRTICELFPGPLFWSYNNKAANTQNNGTCSPKFNTERFDFMARSLVLPYFHWLGTCAMKKKLATSSMAITKENKVEKNNNDDNDDADDDDDDDWVVDEYFRVRGVRHLRICDASIFPSLISAPTALTCAALGHILANMIVNEISKEDASTIKKRE